MRFSTTGQRGLALVALGAAGALLATGCSAGSLGSSEPASSGSAPSTTITFNSGITDAEVASAKAVADAFMAANPTITVKLDNHPGGSEGDNLIKTRLATDDMSEVFSYNNGSLLQALKPEQKLVALDDQPWVAQTEQLFADSSKGSDGKLYGGAYGTAFGGGVLYNIPVYEKLDLEIPKTWDEFMANNKKIKDAGGIDPVEQTYGETWTSQLFVLGDFHNVAAAEPDFADKYTKNQAKYATSPAALKGFEHTQQVHDAGYENKDFASAKVPDGLRMLAQGKGAHYPILSGVVADMVATYPNAAKDVGLFALPGDDAAKNGLTVWTPGGVYIPTTTTGDKLDAAKKFLAFIASPDGCKSLAAAAAPTGPYAVKGCELPADVPQAIKDMRPYLDKPGGSSLALEFLSPVKGPSLSQITVEVGSGIRKATDGAARYDDDVKKQAQQLGLAGW
ncbi:MAG: raffinose/stachyose/melibiose transport system substrate-binding protein [Kribbellaceae bacterium]|nr:raffinose/stachyose/melibiose transport system substrate-binding protein [Kribbellaceae bacterium]